MSQRQYLIQKLSKETITIRILTFGHWNTLIIIQFLKSHLLSCEIHLLYISVGVYQFLKLFVEHLQTMNMNEILNVLKTEFETL